MTRPFVDHKTARRASLVATIWVPIAIVFAAEAVIVGYGILNGGELIVHWGAQHRYGPWWTYAILVAAIGVPVIAITGFFIARATRMSGMNRWMPAVVIGITVFHSIGMGVGCVLLNASALAPALPLAIGVILGAASALLTWRLLPQEEPRTAALATAEPLPVQSGERAAWAGAVDIPAWFATVIAAIASGLLILGVVLVLTVGGRTWLVFVAPLILFAVLIVTSHFVVTAGPQGFIARSVVGWPKLSVPASDIARAGVVRVDPLSDFGGWGIRWVVGPSRKGRWAIVVRSGDALEVVRNDGRSVVVTVDDAEGAASVLQSYVGTRQ